MANANIYVSHSGDNTTGASWAHAYTTLATAITNSGTTGTDFWVDSTQAESGASPTYTFKGVAATPDRMFSVTTAGSTPPVAADLTAGASFASTTSTPVIINGNVYVYGVTLTSGASGNVTAVLGNAATAHDISMNTCKLILGSGTGSGSVYQLGAGTAGVACRITLENTTFKFANAGQGISLNGPTLIWKNTASAIDAGGTLPTTLFLTTNARTSNILLDGVDLSGLTSKAINAALGQGGALQMVNCGLASGYTLGVPSSPGAIPVDLVVSDNTTTNYNQIRKTYMGTIAPSTSVYNNATDGDTPISWTVTATANANPQAPFECWQIVQWAAAGTYAASRVWLTSATASLTNNDVWVDVSYLGSSYPRSSRVTTGNIPLLPSGSAAALDTASASWAVGGLGNNYDLQIPSFTPSVDGYVRFSIKVGKASLVVNIDPAVTIA